MLLFVEFELLLYITFSDVIHLPLSFQARQIVGSAVLVKAGDRPEIEDDEFYSLDLVGMRVIVKVHASLFYFFKILTQCRFIG